eukprot:gene31762-biopygen89228
MFPLHCVSQFLPPCPGAPPQQLRTPPLRRPTLRRILLRRPSRGKTGGDQPCGASCCGVHRAAVRGEHAGHKIRPRAPAWRRAHLRVDQWMCRWLSEHAAGRRTDAPTITTHHGAVRGCEGAGPRGRAWRALGRMLPNDLKRRARAARAARARSARDSSVRHMSPALRCMPRASAEATFSVAFLRMRDLHDMAGCGSCLFPSLPQSPSRHQLNQFLASRLPASAPRNARWHALRRGMVTTTAHMGEHPDVRQRRGRWRSAATARIYARPIRPDAHGASPSVCCVPRGASVDCVAHSDGGATPSIVAPGRDCHHVTEAAHLPSAPPTLSQAYPQSHNGRLPPPPPLCGDPIEISARGVPHFAPKGAIVAAAHIASRRTGISYARLIRTLHMLAAVYNWVRNCAPALAKHLPEPARFLRDLCTADPFRGDDDGYTPPPWRRPFLLRAETTWKPLGATGHLQLSRQQLYDAFDRSRPRVQSDVPPPPKITPMSAAAFKINALAFGWDAAPRVAQSISRGIVDGVILGVADFDAKVYLDDCITIAYDTATSKSGHDQCVDAFDRQVLTGSITWLGIQHRCHLPFLCPAHRFRPPPRGRGVLPARTALSVLASAAVGALPWVGQGPYATPAHRPTMSVFFDGVCIPSRGAFAAAFVPPGLAVLTPVAHADQQHAELVALLLALHVAASAGSKQCTLIGDSTSALFSSIKLSCPSNIPHRSVALRQLSHIILSAGIGYSVQYIPSKFNPADPVSRATPPNSAPVPWVLPRDHPAVARAAELAATARPRPLRQLRARRPR